jgi:ElaB/YqjD/DUF883 family membrane-anchored ribosome-binding protein
MSESRVEGAFQNVAGKVQGAYGDAADQASDLAAAVNRNVEQQPLTALLIAGAVGYMLGWFMHRH